MKLKIKITGHMVQDVGYRIFLGKLAMGLAMPGFIAYNWNEEGLQAVKANTALIPEIAKNTALIPQMAKNTEQILEEVKGIREDQPSFAMQLKQLQQDVQAIKAQLGMH